MKQTLKFLVAASCATVFIASASAAGTPLYVLTPTLTEKPADITTTDAKDAPACSVNVTGLNDLRRDPKTVGIVAGARAVRSPDDMQGWMRAIVGGLSARGVTPTFDTPPDSGAATPVVTVGLKSVWIDPVNTTFSSDVVMTVDATTGDGRTLKKAYRGQITVLNWNNGAGEVQTAITRAFSDALNKIAPDLKALCGPAQG